MELTNPTSTSLPSWASELIPDLHDAIWSGGGHHDHAAWCALEVLQRRGLLVQSEPEGPTDQELLRILRVATPCYEVEQYRTELNAIRQALIRWGRPTIEPVPVAERPWEREGWCDDRGYCWMRRKYEPKGVTWRLIPPPDRYAAAYFLESLPHHALPVPGAEVSN